MRYRTLNEQQAYDYWADPITEAVGVKDPQKIAWMSKVMAINTRVIQESRSEFVNESVIGGYGVQTPANVVGMGDVKWGDVGRANGDITAQNYSKGSGDMVSRQLTFAMATAAYTIGLETLPVIPMEFPSIMYGYMDYIYSGNLNKSQSEQGKNDVYIKLQGSSRSKFETLKRGDRVSLVQVPNEDNGELELGKEHKALYGIYLTQDRISGHAIVKFEGVVTAKPQGAKDAVRTYELSNKVDVAPTTVLGIEAEENYTWALVKGNFEAGVTETIINEKNEILVDYVGYAKADKKKSTEVEGDLASAVDMYIPEFSKPSADYSGNEDFGASRAVGEQGTQNIISLRLFSATVEAKSIEVLGEVTKIQKQDMGVYGLDPIGSLFKSAQNELIQTMNADILRTEFRLGVQNHAQLLNTQGVNLNLYIGDPALNDSKEFSKFKFPEFVDIHGEDRVAEFSVVKNAETNSSAENNATRARRIITRIQAGANLISVVSRQGGGDFVVTSVAVATAIQDIAGYIVNPFMNETNFNKKTMYLAGTINGGIKVYVDPNMSWNDHRILVGRKGDTDDSGLKMFIYTMGEVVQTIGEATMSDKISVSNRYALVPCGFHPETNYLTFVVDNDFGLI